MSGDSEDLDLEETYARIMRVLNSNATTSDVGSSTVRGVSGAVAWTEEIEPLQDTNKWVTNDKDVLVIKEMETLHLKRIIDGFNMEANYYGQQHKLRVLVAEYKQRDDK